MTDSQVKDLITFQIVEIEGRAISGIKLLGLLTEAQYGDEDFSLYVRWDEAHGIVTVDRSDTDERILTQGLTRVGKLEAFQNLMHLLAAKYGTDVVVAADPGIKVSAMAAKMIGTYAAPDPIEVKVAAYCKTHHLDQARADFMVAEMKAAKVEEISIPTNTPVIDGYRWERHTMPGESVWAGSTYQLIQEGTSCQVIATVKHRGHGMWAAQSATWGSTILTHPGFWEGEPLVDAFANVVRFMDFLTRAKAAGLSGVDAGRVDWRTWVAEEIEIPAPGEAEALMAEHDAAMAQWVKPLVAALPIRTPGRMLSNLDIVTAHDEAWQREESAIWAGTESLGSMRVRLPRKVKKARRDSKPRPIDVKRARIMSGSVR